MCCLTHAETTVVGRIFSRGGTVGDFHKIFSRGAKSGEIRFLPLEIEKTSFFANNLKIQGGRRLPAPLPTPVAETLQQPVQRNDL